MNEVSIKRVTDFEPAEQLENYLAAGGGVALATAIELGAAGIVDVVDAAALRGRGGGGFPTGTKWATVARNASDTLPSTVVVNAAEGEPGSYKDRFLLLSNPYKVLEGAAVAALAVGADTVVVVTKKSFAAVVNRVGSALDEMRNHPRFDGIAFEIVEGPDSYLLGEETALLEVVEGRPPFPRVSPPWRHGVDDDPAVPGAATTVMASEARTVQAAPVLVNNVETLAHVTDILARGPEWFASAGLGETEGTGTFLCTVTGATQFHQVAEFAIGATLTDVLMSSGGGVDGPPSAVLPGVSHPIVGASDFDRPLGYGPDSLPVGAGAFRFLSEDDDPRAVAAGVSRFLAVESCGQCTPCKHDGLAISSTLQTALTTGGPPAAAAELDALVGSVAEGARCALARQHQEIVGSVLKEFPLLAGRSAPVVEPIPIVPLRSIEGGVAIEETDQQLKQPDWTHDDPWSGSTPVELVDVASGER